MKNERSKKETFVKVILFLTPLFAALIGVIIGSLIQAGVSYRPYNSNHPEQYIPFSLTFYRLFLASLIFLFSAIAAISLLTLPFFLLELILERGWTRRLFWGVYIGLYCLVVLYLIIAPIFFLLLIAGLFPFIISAVFVILANIFAIPPAID